MANIRFLFRNLVDTATVTASPALLAGLPATNLQTQQRNRSARTTSTASQDFSFSWPTAQTIDMIAMRRFNLTAAAQMACPTYSDSAFTTSIAANAAANCFGYTGLDANDILTESDFILLKNFARFPTLSSVVQSLKVTVTDAANPDGYFDISRMFIGKLKELFYQVSYSGALLTMDDASTQRRMDDGSLVSDKRFKFRKLEINQNYCAPSDWASILSALRFVGKDKDVFISVFPTAGDYTEVYYQGAFKFTGMSAFDRNNPNAAGMRMIFEET